MPATRSLVKSKGTDASNCNPLSVSDDDDVIIISSDEEDVDSTSYALKKSQQEVRSLKEKLLAKEKSSNQILSDYGNHPAESLSSARLNKIEAERLRLKTRLQQTTMDFKKLQAVIRLEKKARADDISRLERRAKKAEEELANVQTINEELHNELKLLHEKVQSNIGGNNQALEDLENHILCEVCTEKLWNPHTLSECGHTFCQECLTDWFNTAVAANAYHPQYTCPTCRTPVHQKPVEDFALKGVVRAISRVIDPAGGSPPAPPRNQYGHGQWYRFFR